MFKSKQKPAEPKQIRFKDQVRQVRKFSWMSPRQFSKYLGISVIELAMLEWGAVKASDETISRVMADWVQIDAENL